MLVLLLTDALAAPPALEAIEYQLPRYCEAVPNREATTRRLTQWREKTEEEAQLGWSEAVGRRQESRRSMLYDLIVRGRICAPEDHWAAAVILQSSRLDEDQLLAHIYAFHAMANGIPQAEQLSAMSYDRWLVSRGRPQWYGTQVRTDGQYRTCLVEIDPRATDSERTDAGLETLDELIRHTQERNGRSPTALGLTGLKMVGLYCEPVAWDPKDSPSAAFAAAFGL